MHPEQIKIFKAMSGAKKLEIAANFYLSARNLKSQSLRCQHPDWTEEQIRQKTKELFLYAAN